MSPSTSRIQTPKSRKNRKKLRKRHEFAAPDMLNWTFLTDTRCSRCVAAESLRDAPCIQRLLWRGSTRTREPLWADQSPQSALSGELSRPPVDPRGGHRHVSFACTVGSHTEEVLRSPHFWRRPFLVDGADERPHRGASEFQGNRDQWRDGRVTRAVGVASSVRRRAPRST